MTTHRKTPLDEVGLLEAHGVERFARFRTRSARRRSCRRCLTTSATGRQGSRCRRPLLPRRRRTNRSSAPHRSIQHRANGTTPGRYRRSATPLRAPQRRQSDESRGPVHLTGSRNSASRVDGDAATSKPRIATLDLTDRDNVLPLRRFPANRLVKARGEIMCILGRQQAFRETSISWFRDFLSALLAAGAARVTVSCACCLKGVRLTTRTRRHHQLSAETSFPWASDRRNLDEPSRCCHTPTNRRR